MENKDKLLPKEVWGTLSEPEKEVCIYLAVAHWQSGVGWDYLSGMGSDKGNVDELVKRGVIDSRPRWQFAQEWLDQHREELEGVENKLKNPLAGLSDDEKSFLSTARNRQLVVEHKTEETGYRLAGKEFYDYINKEHSDLM